MAHLWLRAEERPNEERTGLTPEGAAKLIGLGMRVTVEHSGQRAIAIDAYHAAGCETAPEGSWRTAPPEALILGLKELPDDDTPLAHRHIMFGHAFKGQAAGQRLLKRLRAGGGRLYDLEYLVDAQGRRVAAFGYWAGYAGAAVALLAWAAQARGAAAGPLARFAGKQALLGAVSDALAAACGSVPRVLVIGALGRVGSGACDLCNALKLPVTRWDIAETAHGGPFGQVLDHEIFLNCILAMPGCPVFVPADAGTAPRRLRVIGDIACDPGSDFSPIKVNTRLSDWVTPALRVHEAPPLDVVAIDNLPALLPIEASQDFAAQLLPHLAVLAAHDPDDAAAAPVWARAGATFDRLVVSPDQERNPT